MKIVWSWMERFVKSVVKDILPIISEIALKLLNIAIDMRVLFVFLVQIIFSWILKGSVKGFQMKIVRWKIKIINVSNVRISFSF